MTTIDGGTTQLAAAISEEYFEEKFERNEDHAKLSKNRSAVFQPADTGKGHKGQRQQTQKLSRQPFLTLSIGDHFDNEYYKLSNEGKVNLLSLKSRELCDITFCKFSSPTKLPNQRKGWAELINKR